MACMLLACYTALHLCVCVGGWVHMEYVCVYLDTESHQCHCLSFLYIMHSAPVLGFYQAQGPWWKNGSTQAHFLLSPFFVSPFLSSPSASRTMSRPTGGGANDVTRFLSSGAGPGSPTSNAVFSAASQADWAAKRLVWVPSEKHGFEVSGYCPLKTFWFFVSNKHQHQVQVVLDVKSLNKLSFRAKCSLFLQLVFTFFLDIYLSISLVVNN